MTPIEQRLRDELAAAACAVDPSPDTVGTMLRAGRRRLRTRRQAVVMAVTAVLAVAALTGTNVLRDEHGARRGPAHVVETPTPTMTPSPAPAATPDPAVVAWLHALPAGAPVPAEIEVKIPYLLYQGRRHVLSEEIVPRVLRSVPGGWLVFWHPDGSTGGPDPSTVLGVLSSASWRLRAIATGVLAGAALSPDGTRVAYGFSDAVYGNTELRVASLATGAVLVTGPTLRLGVVLDWGADGVVARAEQPSSLPSTIGVWRPGGAWRAIQAGAAAQAGGHRVMVLFGDCSRVLDVPASGGAHMVWEGCADSAGVLGSMSPDGRHVLTRSLRLVDLDTGAVRSLGAPRRVEVGEVRWTSPSTAFVGLPGTAAPPDPRAGVWCHTSGRCETAVVPG